MCVKTVSLTSVTSVALYYFSSTSIPTSAALISTSVSFPIPSNPNPIFSNPTPAPSCLPPTPYHTALMGPVAPPWIPSPDLHLTPDPLFLGDELTTAFSKSPYFCFRMPIFQGFDVNSPFPSIIAILFPTDPQNRLGLFRLDRLDVLIKNLKIDICNLNPENSEEMVKKKLN